MEREKIGKGINAGDELNVLGLYGWMNKIDHGILDKVQKK